MTITCAIVSLAREKVPLDEWPPGSSCSFRSWLMRCVTVLRLIEATETYGHLWSVSMFGSHASLTSRRALGTGTGRPPPVAGFLRRRSDRERSGTDAKVRASSSGRTLVLRGCRVPGGGPTFFRFRGKRLINRQSGT